MTTTPPIPPCDPARPDAPEARRVRSGGRGAPRVLVACLATSLAAGSGAGADGTAGSTPAPAAGAVAGDAPTDGAKAPGYSGFIGRWAGDGTVFGGAGRMELAFEPVLGGRFLRLVYRVTPSGSGRAPFEGIAYYAAAGPGAMPPDGPGTVTGTWFDSWGATYSLRATVDATRWVVDWSAPGGRSGRSTYALAAGGSLEASDETLAADGTWRAFNRATLRPEGAGDAPAR